MTGASPCRTGSCRPSEVTMEPKWSCGRPRRSRYARAGFVVGCEDRGMHPLVVGGSAVAALECPVRCWGGARFRDAPDTVRMPCAGALEPRGGWVGVGGGGSGKIVVLAPWGWGWDIPVRTRAFAGRSRDDSRGSGIQVLFRRGLGLGHSWCPCLGPGWYSRS